MNSDRSKLFASRALIIIFLVYVASLCLPISISYRGVFGSHRLEYVLHAFRLFGNQYAVSKLYLVTRIVPNLLFLFACVQARKREWVSVTTVGALSLAIGSQIYYQPRFISYVQDGYWLWMASFAMITLLGFWQWQAESLQPTEIHQQENDNSIGYASICTMIVTCFYIIMLLQPRDVLQSYMFLAGRPVSRYVLMDLFPSILFLTGCILATLRKWIAVSIVGVSAIAFAAVYSWEFQVFKQAVPPVYIMWILAFHMMTGIGLRQWYVSWYRRNQLTKSIGLINTE